MCLQSMNRLVLCVAAFRRYASIRSDANPMAGWKMYDLGRHCHRHLGWVAHSGPIINRWRRRWGSCRPEGAQIPIAGSHSHVHSFGIWDSRPYKCKGLCFSCSTWSTPLSLYWRHARNFFLISTLAFNYKRYNAICFNGSLISTPNHS